MARSIPLILLAVMVTVLGACSGKSKVRLTEPNQNHDIQKAIDFVEKAERAQEKGDLDAAIDHYLDAIQASPGLPIAWHNVGCAYASRGTTGDNLRAATHFNRAADLAPNDPLPVYSLGCLYHRNNNLDQAILYYDEALRRYPNHLPSLRESIRLDHELGIGDEETEQRIDRAMMLETEDKWRDMFIVETRRIRERGYDN